MSDNKKYYYLKLKENFFDSDEITILENMPNGYKYSNLLLKLYLKSLRNNGALRLNEYIPYDANMIAAITRIDVDTVKVAMDIFQKLKLIEVLEDGTIFVLQIQNYIGESSTEADRIRSYRNKIEEQKQNLLPVQMYDKCTPEIELDTDTELDTEKEVAVTSQKNEQEDIFEYWNSKDIIKHRKLDDKIKRAINGALKTYQYLEIVQAIDNYNTIVKEDKYYWTYEWTLKDFLLKGLDKFMDFEKAAKNYAKDKPQSVAKKTLGKASNERQYDCKELEKNLLGRG